MHKCPACGSDSVSNGGLNKRGSETGAPRRKCSNLDCKKTFNANSAALSSKGKPRKRNSISSSVRPHHMAYHPLIQSFFYAPPNHSNITTSPAHTNSQTRREKRLSLHLRPPAPRLKCGPFWTIAVAFIWWHGKVMVQLTIPGNSRAGFRSR